MMTRMTVSSISIQSFLLWLSSRFDQVQPPITVNIFFVYFVDGYVTASLYNCLLEVSVDIILSQVHNNAHIYTHIHTHTHLHTRQTHKVLPAVYYSCHLVISSYRKSYQQYHDNLLNYKKLEISCYKNKKS